ncbi:hypothetical protein [Acinetobacter sp. ANC 5414]|uniref:hypothetical protein n=1 Tax=Acinetobacter sp. ANC 5414 TaxID=2731251 RepID=UPI00148F8A0E|nr:hypothetical protein [Acinetobacter sp. ANC 5414]NNG99877.1 hypothetical protein [Acinetobacter sp. ANC 5414]
MLNEDFEKQYKEYFNDFGERGFTLAWVYFACNPTNLQQDVSQENLPVSLPNNDMIKNDVIEQIKKQNNPKETLELTHLFIKNMIIKDDFLKSIDKKDNILISYLIINILKSPILTSNYQTSPENHVIKPSLSSNTQTILIPESNKYESLNKKTKLIKSPDQKNIQIPIINHLNKIKQSDDLFDIFIFLLDKYEITLKYKKEYLSNLLNHYETIKNNKKIYKWIDQNNPEQIQWILHYFQNILKFQIYLYPIDYIKTINRKCNHYEIVFLLLAELPNFNKELTILKLKKAWSQQKFRMSGKAKKAYHLPLTKETNKKLKTLSEVLNKTESQILENLIEEKYRITILDENGRPKY